MSITILNTEGDILKFKNGIFHIISKTLDYRGELYKMGKSKVFGIDFKRLAIFTYTRNIKYIVYFNFPPNNYNTILAIKQFASDKEYPKYLPKLSIILEHINYRRCWDFGTFNPMLTYGHTFRREKISINSKMNPLLYKYSEYELFINIINGRYDEIFKYNKKMTYYFVNYDVETDENKKFKKNLYSSLLIYKKINQIKIKDLRIIFKN